MDFSKGMHTKTALEHLIFLNSENIVGICRKLGITPQQFSDWIKHRRPIPAERLAQFTEFFGVPAGLLADEKRFARPLSELGRIELEMLVVAHKSEQCPPPEEKAQLKYRLGQLEDEKEKQLRIARLTTLLNRNDAHILQKIDRLLDELEKE